MNDWPVSLVDTSATAATPPAPSRFLSEAACTALTQRATHAAMGGGNTFVHVESRWVGNLRWARNQISTSGDVRDNVLDVARNIRGAKAVVHCNQIDDANLTAAVRRAEYLLRFEQEMPDSTLYDAYEEPLLHPNIWFDTTYDLDAEHRASVMRTLVQPAVAAGMVSAGYLEVAAHGRAVMNSRGQSLYYPYTTAQYSVTVRDPKGTGSGWAGVDWNDWARIDATHLSEVALDKCLRSRNPVAIEPGRYTAVLEPQAVCDLFSSVIEINDRSGNESQPDWPFHKGQALSKIGDQILDARLTVSADPMDPDLGFPPFDGAGDVYHPVVWIKDGVLTDLSYNRSFGVSELGLNTGLPSSGAYRVSGGTTSIDEMIATTKRGLLVTRFWNVQIIDLQSLLSSGYTRDGLWLIENGKISKPVKNFRFTESPLFVFNQIDQLGVPVRVFHPDAPVVVPPIKVRDFSFTSLADAV